MAIYKKLGKFYVDNLNVKLIEELVNRYKTNQEFLKTIGFNNIVLTNIRNGGKVTIGTIDKFLDLFEDIAPKDLILDYKESDYVHFEIDLKRFKPSEADLKDCENIMVSYSRTIREFTNFLGLEKQNKIMNLLKRIILEAQYYGVMLEKMNRSAKLINTVENVRNNRQGEFI